MGCGHGVGGVLMEDLLYPQLWRDRSSHEDKNNNCQDDGSASDHDIRKLFPKKDDKTRRKKPITKKKVGNESVSKRGTPEWLAVSVGVFFVGALFTIASYQVYQGSKSGNIEVGNVPAHEPADVPLADEEEPIPEPVYNKPRLPGDVVPVSYVLYARVDVKKKRYNGLVRIEVLAKDNTSRVILHSNYHHIKEIQIKTADKHNIYIEKISINKKQEMLILSLNERLISGHKYNIIIGFNATLTYTYNNGISVSKYKDGNGNEREMVSTDLEPSRARKFCPCFDEPAMKATWKLIISPQNKGFTASSNMPVEKTKTLDNGLVEVFFQTTPVMSTYLVIIMVSEYEHYSVQSPQKNITIGIYYPIGRKNEATKAIEYGTFAVDYFSVAFGIDYMLPKLDMFPVSKFSAGADETWGDIVFDERALLVDTSKASDGAKKAVARTVSHEISHQWFGDLVTMEWWDDLWLKESFAAYLEVLPVTKMNPKWDACRNQFNDLVSALSFDFSPYTHAIQHHDETNLLNSFDSITYQKGASIVNMLAHYVGPEKIMNGLRVYLNKYKYGNAHMVQLWDALSEGADVDVKKLMNSWVTLSGFPLINIKKNEKNKFTVSQAKYDYIYSTEADSGKQVDSSVWQVPIKFMTCGKEKSSQDVVTLLKTKQAELTVDHGCENFYKINFGATGYYHVNYDEDNWRKLIHIFNANHELIPPVDRSSILYDAFSITSSNNNPDITIPLDFSRYLDKEFHPDPWNNGMTIMTRIHHVFYHTPIKKCVESFVALKMKPVLDKLDSAKHHNQEQLDLIRSLFGYAVEYKIQPWSKIIQEHFLKWAARGGVDRLPPNLRSTILCGGVKHGDEMAFNAVNTTLQTSKSVSDYYLYHSTLACSQDKLLLNRLLDVAVKKKDAQLLLPLCGNRRARKMTWEAIKDNWEALYNKYSETNGLIKFLFNSCIAVGTTAEELKDVENFLKTKNVGRFKIFALRGIDSMKRNIDFATRHEDTIESWFKRHSNCL